MGGPMAHNLLKAGHTVTFFARRPEIMSEFQTAGGVPAESPAAVARKADFIITIVPTDREVKEVVLGENGVLAGGGPGKTLIEMSTINPATVRELGRQLREHRMSALDAPVSGGPSGARNATLTIMVGGDAEDVQRAQPVLQSLGERTIHCGPLGAGQTIKVINQMMAGSIMAIIGEGFALAQAAGADLERFAEVVSVSSGGSTMFTARKKMVLTDSYDPAFRTELMRKDVGLALEMARDFGVPMPLAAAAFQQYTATMQSGYAKLDFAAVARLCRQLSGKPNTTGSPS